MEEWLLLPQPVQFIWSIYLSNNKGKLTKSKSDFIEKQFYKINALSISI